MALNDKSTFRVIHRGVIMGRAVMFGNRVRFTPDIGAFPIFEAQEHGWLLDFQKVVRKLCRSVGHVGRFSISLDVDSGVEVERL